MVCISNEDANFLQLVFKETLSKSEIIQWCERRDWILNAAPQPDEYRKILPHRIDLLVLEDSFGNFIEIFKAQMSKLSTGQTLSIKTKPSDYENRVQEVVVKFSLVQGLQAAVQFFKDLSTNTATGIVEVRTFDAAQICRKRNLYNLVQGYIDRRNAPV